jgi:hypothetical protein
MTETNEKKEGSCCKSSGSCCGCKKLFVGILLGVLIAVIGHCFICGKGSMCGQQKMCPMMHATTQAPAQ